MHACTLWDPYTYKNIFMLESVQKFARKVCLKWWDLDYNSMLHLLGITRLSTRYQCLKLVLLYKAVNGLTYFPPGILFLGRHPTCPVVTLTLILLDHFLVQIMLIASSFVPNVIMHWNNLLNFVKSSSSVSSTNSPMRTKSMKYG